MSASPPPTSRQLRAGHPGVVVLAHPECPPEVVAEADFAGSTAAMADYVDARAAGPRRADDRMLDERQHRRAQSRHRLRAALQSLSAHEAHHAAQDPPRARDHAARSDDRSGRRRGRPPRRRAHAGGPLGEAAHADPASRLRRLPRHHRRRPCRADDRAAAGAAARHPAGQGAIVRGSGLGLGPGRHRRRRGRGRPAGPARRRHLGGRRRPQRSGRRQPHRRGGAGGHHRAGAPRRGVRPRSGRPPGARPGGSARPPPHRPCRGRRHGGRDHARPGRRGAGHALDHGDRGAGSPPPAGRRPRHCRRAGGGPVRRLPAAEPPGRAGDRRAGRALRPHHQPAGRHRPGAGAGRAGRRGAGRHGVRAVPSDRARCRARSHAAGQRGRARRGRGAGRRDRRALHGGPRPRRARAARRRLARGGGAHRGRPSRLPRCPAGARRGLRKTFPRHHRALPGRRHRSRAPADPGASGGALPHGRHRRGRRGPQHDRGPVGLRRGGGKRPARRQSAGQQFAARGGGHGERGGRQHRRHRAGAAAGSTAGRSAAGAGRDGPARPDQRDAGRRARPRRPASGRSGICSRSPSRAAVRPIRRWSP